MKKNIMFSVIVTIFINFGLFLFDLISVYNTHHLPLSVKINGGEYMAERGFGILIEKIYPLTTMSEEGVRRL